MYQLLAAVLYFHYIFLNFHNYEISNPLHEHTIKKSISNHAIYPVLHVYGTFSSPFPSIVGKFYDFDLLYTCTSMLLDTECQF